jgi:chloramphenicol 3-O-phosphotransferase
MDRDVSTEIYLALQLLGAEPMLLAAVQSWRDGLPEKDVVADLRNWNEAKLLEIKEWLPTMTGPELEAAQERVRLYEQARQALKKAA